jgi:beta-N-acetylhexosaminidase
MVMTAHILNPKLDPDRPATLSPRVLRDILRKQLRFSGIVVSDDMEMKAITDHFGTEDAPRMAIEAGCDLLTYRTEAAARHAYASLLKALEDGKLAPNLVTEAVERLNALKRETLLPYQPTIVAEVAGKVGTPENQALIDKIKV